MIESTCGENHRVVVGPFGCICPLLTTVVPEMTSRQVAHDTVGEILPHAEREVDLQQQNTEDRTSRFINRDNFN